MESKCYKKNFVYRVSDYSIKDTMMSHFGLGRSTGYLGTGLYAYGDPYPTYPLEIQKIIKKTDFNSEEINLYEIYSVITKKDLLNRYKINTSNLCFYKTENDYDFIETSRLMTNASIYKTRFKSGSEFYLELYNNSINDLQKYDNEITKNYKIEELIDSIEASSECIINHDYEKCVQPINHLLYKYGFDGVVPDAESQNSWGVVIYPHVFDLNDGDFSDRKFTEKGFITKHSDFGKKLESETYSIRDMNFIKKEYDNFKFK